MTQTMISVIGEKHWVVFRKQIRSIINVYQKQEWTKVRALLYSYGNRSTVRIYRARVNQLNSAR